MEIVETLHMNKGTGQTSYAMNSALQNKVISLTKQATEKAIMKTLCSKRWPKMKMEIADLGCSSGPNALRVVSEIYETINATSSLLNQPAPKEVMYYMNDLFTNDFNNVFGSLPSFYKKIRNQKGYNGTFGSNCFVYAVPGSFYDRLFPSNSLHFVRSSSSIHWLSKVPCGLEDKSGRGLNKGKIYVSKSSPNYVFKAYSQQFQNDFSQFLKLRSQEIVNEGRMVLSLMGRQSMDPTSPNLFCYWEFLAQALMIMVLEGLVEEEKVDSFNAPYYTPCFEELKMEIEKEGSFMVDSHEAYEVGWDDDGIELPSDHGLLGRKMSSGEKAAKTIRAGVESMLEFHFGSHIMDDLFQIFAKLVDEHLSKTKSKFNNLVISLVKRQ